MKSPDILFDPYVLGEMNLPNRIAMAPMTRSLSPGGVPGEDVADYYAKRAEGGAGLVITEGTYINSRATIIDGAVPRFFGNDALAGWRRVVEKVHAVGGRIMPQLWHVGLVLTRGSTLNVDSKPDHHAELGQIGPSGVISPGRCVCEPMSQSAIDAVIDAFATAATSAQEIGCDGVEIHGAHGYLVDQFFWAVTNHRVDAYGGNLASRGRFAGEIIAEIRRRVRPHFPIVLRISQWKQQDYAARLAGSPDDMQTILAPSVDAGVNMFHCSQRRFWEAEFAGDDRNLAGWVKKLTGVATMTVGSVGLDREFLDTLMNRGSAAHSDLSKLVAMFERGDFDMVAVGRALIGDPAWPLKVRAGNIASLLPFDATKLRELI